MQPIIATTATVPKVAPVNPPENPVAPDASGNGRKDDPSLEGQLQNRRDQEKAAVQKEAQEKNVEPELVHEALQHIDQRYRPSYLL